MSKNTSMTLGKHFDSFIAHKIEEGRFASASEVVRAALRRLLEEGEQSGTAEYSYESLMNELDDELS